MPVFFFWWICYQEVNMVAFLYNTVAHQITPINGFNLKPNFSQFLFVYLAFLIVKTPDNLVDLFFISLKFV